MRKSHVHWPITLGFSFILLVGLLFKGPLTPLPAQAADYPADPSTDVKWDFSTESSVTDVQTRFNTARTSDNTVRVKLTLPSQAEWDSKSGGEKALWLINQERIDRGLLPLSGLESNVTSVAQAYAQYLLENDAFSHDADGLGPWKRLEANSTINACHDFLGVAENLAVLWSNWNFPIERAVYNWMYDDSGSSWGHRHAILWNSYTNNSGPSESEGFLGIGNVKGRHKGYSDSDLIVMNVFDPCPTWNDGPSVITPTPSLYPSSPPVSSSPPVTPYPTKTPYPTATLRPYEPPATQTPIPTKTKTPLRPTSTPSNPYPEPDLPPPDSDGSFADSAFEKVWERTDQPLARGAPGLQARSWIWGPMPLTGGSREAYAEGQGGTRLVQYFDKSRMEINNPNAARDKWYVTNGRLVAEMVEGFIQIGNSSFRESTPADEAVAGDAARINSDAPTYRSFRSIAFPVNAAPAARRKGQTVIAVLKKDGTTVDETRLANYNITLDGYDETIGHNIPRIFTDYFIQPGIVYEGGKYVQGMVMDWKFVLGLPISEPYWAKVKVGGGEKDVLMQAFERRVLTYTPDNPTGYKVEMGNVGLHYLSWRYARSATCAMMPVLGFGKLWQAEAAVREMLGCAIEAETTAQGTVQYFPNGVLYWRNKVIYAFLGEKEGTWQSFKEADLPNNRPSYSCPTGRIKPTLGFGSLMVAHPEIANALGQCATSSEESGNGAMQMFQKGWMLSMPATSSSNEKRIWVASEKGEFKRFSDAN